MTVQITKGIIVVLHGQDTLFTVDTEWCEETLTCKLSINDEVLPLWRISQRAIGKLMFG